MITNDELTQACAQAMRWLSRREYCRQELLLRLRQKGFTADVADRAAQWLMARDLLNDARYAESAMRVQLRRGYTPHMAACKVRQSGVDEDELTNVIAKCAQVFDAEHACRNLLLKRDGQCQRFSDQRLRARLIRYLCARGFESSLVFRLVDEDDSENAE